MRFPSLIAGVCLSLVVLSTSLVAATAGLPAAPQHNSKVFRAGAAAVDITPTKFPVIVSGMFEERTANRAQDPLHARCLVLDDGTTRLALVIVDSLMMPRELLDRVKQLAQETTGIRADHILIAATHTHSAPSVMGALGSRSDPAYSEFLAPQLVRVIDLAVKSLRPAQVGWTVATDWDHTFNRRWIRRPDRLLKDPFGNLTVRANMHPGHQNPDVIGPSGPVDPDLALLAVQTPQGQPIALLANYSMHYVGSTPVSADYFGHFAAEIKKQLAPQQSDPLFVGIMSQGTSGDLMWMDYSKPRSAVSSETYAAELARVALDGYRRIRYRDWVPLAMRETKLSLNRRVPDDKRLAWARETAASIQGPIPKGQPQIYAREAIFLHEEPRRELKLQALRIGELGITAIPNEVFALTGLKLKAQSPLDVTFNIELANGAEGYIPPPEQHKLGGYTTWPARTAGLEESAEPKIVAALLGLLEQVSGKPRRQPVETHGPYAEAVLADKPLAYWRLGDMTAPTAADSAGNHPATYEDGVALFLDGPRSPRFSGDRTVNRAAHFAGGRLRTELKGLGEAYSIELWLWNGLPTDARGVTGYLFTRGPENEPTGDHLALGGAGGARGRLFFHGPDRKAALAGRTEIPLRTWNHVALVREGKMVTVYLNGKEEIKGETETVLGSGPAGRAVGPQLFFGGQNNKTDSWEGKLDEIAVYPAALTPAAVARHFQAARWTLESAQTGPLSSEQAIPQFRLPPGLRAELVAAEPDVQSPVAMAFDEDGRLWVVEMLDYPRGPGPGKPPEGRIRLLEDREGTGRYRATGVFADQLLFANGVMPWKGGLVVTAAPSIQYLKDTRGTGKADLRQKLYEGFATENPQLRVSHPLLGLDNWIYVANGLRGGQIRRSGREQSPINISGRDFRFDLIHDRAEAVTGMGQYGNTFDDWGNRFVCTNRNHWVHLVLPERYVRRNPYLAVPPPHRDNQGPGGSARVYPLSRQETTALEHAGSFTAACGVLVYRGSLLPEAFKGSVFTCEPTGNLVHQEIFLPRGASFTGRPAQPGVEFLATTDEWFRPVFLTHGPDGALYVVDMYRKVIEHPEWLPPAQKNRPDLLEGKDRGRIWRIVPEQAPVKRVRPHLSQATTRQLVELLAHPDVWWRTTAQRLLLERQDPQAGPMLQKLVTSSDQPLARIHAAWLLEQRGQLDAERVLALLDHPQPGVRQQGVRLAERWLSRSEPIQKRILQLADDPDSHLRFQVALSLGEWDDPRILKPLTRIAVAQADDSWTRLAVASSLPNRAGQALVLLFQPDSELLGEVTPDRLLLVQELAALVGSRQDPREVADVVEAMLALTSGGRIANPSYQMAARKGLAEGLLRRGTQLAAFLQKLPPERRGLLDRMNALMTRTLALARDGRGNAPERIEAVQTLAHADWKTVQPVLVHLIREDQASEVRLAAVRALASFANPEVASILVQAMANQPPPVQREIQEALFSQPERTLVLLAEIEAGRVRTEEIDHLRRIQLLNHRRSDIRSRAGKLLANQATVERKQVIEAFRPTLKLPGDPRRGREVFQKATCASCHRVGDLGVALGPDISDTRTKTLDALLVDILDPNAAIDANFVGYIITLKSGKALTGLLASETASSITLRRPDQQTDVVLRQDIEPDGIVASGKSLMPEGLEKNLTQQEMADLLAFLRRWRELEKKP